MRRLHPTVKYPVLNYNNKLTELSVLNVKRVINFVVGTYYLYDLSSTVTY